jgi:hypothetical protein
MVPVVELLRSKGVHLPIPEQDVAAMVAENQSKLDALDQRLKDAEVNQGETEIKDTMLAKADFLKSIGDKVCLFVLFVFSLFCISAFTQQKKDLRGKFFFNVIV